MIKVNSIYTTNYGDKVTIVANTSECTGLQQEYPFVGVVHSSGQVFLYNEKGEILSDSISRSINLKLVEDSPIYA